MKLRLDSRSAGCAMLTSTTWQRSGSRCRSPPSLDPLSNRRVLRWFSAVQEASDEDGTGPCRWLTLRQAGYWNTRERSHWLKTAVRGTESCCVCASVWTQCLKIQWSQHILYDEYVWPAFRVKAAHALHTYPLLWLARGNSALTTTFHHVRVTGVCRQNSNKRWFACMTENISFLPRFGAGARHLPHSSDCQTRRRQWKTTVLIR